ncbi:MAG: DUF5686 family protein [Syntrophothermus sp.]
MTSKGISYSLIQSADSTVAVTTNPEGSYEVILPAYKNRLIASAPGYISSILLTDTTNASRTEININLMPSIKKSGSGLFEKSLTANDIISLAINEKGKMTSGLKNYEFSAYNRCVIRENNGVGIGSGSVRMDPGIFTEAIDLISNIWQEKPMKIDGIYEYLSNGRFSSPSSYNETYENSGPRSGLSPALSSLLGTRRVQNLSGGELLFFDRSMPGPLSAEARKYYGYSLADTLLTDYKYVYKIKFAPLDHNDPGLEGFVYIEDGSFRIMRIEADLNPAANTGNMMKKISLQQQYAPFQGGYTMPVDYRVFVSSNYVGIVKIEYELFSSINSYIFNMPEKSTVFIGSVPAVLPQDGEKGHEQWTKMRTVPLTHEEAEAYKRIDSIKSISRGYVNTAARILAPRYQINEHYSISGPAAIYQFNHVEGQTVGISLFGDNLFNNTIDGKINLSNGFSDKKFKQSFSVQYLPDEKAAEKISINAYNKLAVLFSSSEMYSPLTATILSLLSTRDIRKYYYTSGFDVRTDAELTHYFSAYIQYSNHVDHSAATTTNFSLLGGRYRRSYRSSSGSLALADSVNPPVYDVRLNTISLGFNFDFRNSFMENNIKRRTANGHSFISYGGGILISDPKYLGSGIGFVSYGLNLQSEIQTFGTSSLGIAVNGVYSNGPVPMQMQYALAGNINATGRNHSFRTIGVGALFGDQVLSVTLEYNFRKDVYRLLPVSILRNISINSFFNAGWKNMSEKSAAIMPVGFTVLTRPLFETGFSLGYSSLPVGLELAWRLTHIEKGSFRFGINTSIL